MVELNGKRALASLAVAVSLTFSGTTLWAQDPPAEPTPTETEEADAPDEREAVVDIITVTAQKREENIQEVPAAVTALDAEKIELLSGGAADVKMLSGRVPSLTMESSFGRAFPRFYIRGLGNTDFDLNASQPVSMIVDEVVLENPVVKGMPLFDLERVEVLRGPQGTLFGRNTPAGIVKFDTKKPAQERDASVRLSYGTFDTIDLKAAVGGALTDTISGRAAVLYQSQSDWVDNKFTGENDALGGHDTTAYRLQLLFEPSDDFSALVNVHGWSVDGTARIFRANIIKSGEDDLVSGFEQDEVFHDGKNEQHIDAMGGVLKLDWNLGGSTLTSVTGYETLEMYSRGDVDGGFGCGFCSLPNGPGFVPFPVETADGIPDLDQTTQELRLASDTGGDLDYLVGFYYFDESLRVDTFGFNSLAPGNPSNGDFSFQTQDTKSWALFGSLDYAINELWSVKGGVRYTTDEKDFTAERPAGPAPTIRPIVETTDADLITWDLTATREINENVNVYGRVGTGFRAPTIQGRISFCPTDTEGGTNPATNCVSVAEEEEILSAEIGFKSELLERKLRLNVALYQYEVEGQQLVAVGGQSNTARLINADTTDGYGAELDLDWAPSAHWLVTVGSSYNHTEIDDPNLGVAPCGGGCTVLDPVVNGFARIDGNSLPQAPEWIFNGIVDYRRPLGDGLFLFSVDWAYSSEKSFFLYESVEFNSDSFELGARVGYTFPGAVYEVAAFARNLTDEEIVQAGIDFNNLTGMTNEPRQIGVELVARW